MTREVFIISVFASAIAAGVVIIFQGVWNGFQGKKNFKKFEGEYEGFSYISQDPQSSGYNKYKENGATVTITYISLNKFKIVNTCEGQTWEGYIYMKNKNIGDLTWKYNSNPLRIGSKEISFWESGTEKIVYLNERFDKKYGRELLIKRGGNDT